MSVIQISNLTFSYDNGSEPIFENLNLRLESSWCLGLTGRNGRGKTTLLNLLENRSEFSDAIHASVDFRIFPYPIENPEITVRDLKEKTAAEAEDWELLAELSMLELFLEEEDLNRPLSSFSKGEQGKIMLACQFLHPDAFLLFDEPETSLDQMGRLSLLRYLKQKQGFILVSHDRMLLDAVTDHTLAIEKKKIRVFKGSFSTWLQEKEKEDQSLLQKNECLKKEIGRLEYSVQRSRSWAARAEKSVKKKEPNQKIDRGFYSAKAAKAQKRRKNLELRQQKALEEKKGLLENLEVNEQIELPAEQARWRILLHVEEVSMKIGEKPVNPVPVTFDLHPGERIALKGRNGAGKSTLIQAILEGNIQMDGRIERPGTLRISAVRQNLDALEGTLHSFAKKNGLNEVRFLAVLRKMGMAREDFTKDLSRMSMGQKKKAALAASLVTPAHLFIWDEPLNHLDVVSRIQLESMILESNSSMIFVEHDQMFSERIATHFYDLETGCLYENRNGKRG